MNTFIKPVPSAPALSTHVVVWRYSLTAVVLHWSLALLLAASAGIGWYMMSIEGDPGAGEYVDLHKSVGIVIALLVAARLAWALTHRAADLPSSVPRWQVRLARLTQWALYATMALMPLTGYLGAAHSKAGVALFGLVTPRWALPDHDRAEWFFDIHSVLIWVMVAFVVAHVAGALKHLLWDRDGVFQRMGLARRS